MSQISPCEGNISPQIWSPDPFITELSDSKKMPFLLGEDDNTAALAAKYVLTIHNVRCSTWFTWYWPTWSFHIFRMILILFIIYVVIYLPMLLLYILYIYWCFGNIVLRSHANKAYLNLIWERERLRERREREVLESREIWREEARREERERRERQTSSSPLRKPYWLNKVSNLW